MAVETAHEALPITLEAVATRVVDHWVIDVTRPQRVSVRVEKLENAEAAVRAALARRKVGVPESVVDLHIYWYR